MIKKTYADKKNRQGIYYTRSGKSIDTERLFDKIERIVIRKQSMGMRKESNDFRRENQR